MPSTGSLVRTRAVRVGTNSKKATPPQNNAASAWEPLLGPSVD